MRPKQHREHIMVITQMDPATKCVCQAVVYVTLVVTTLPQLKQFIVAGSVPTAGGTTMFTGTPGGGGGMLPEWGWVLLILGGCGYTPVAVNCLGCGWGYTFPGAANGSPDGATKPYCGLPTTAEYGGGRSSGAEGPGPWLDAIVNVFSPSSVYVTY